MEKGIVLVIAFSLISLSACSSGENGQPDQSGEMSMDDVTLTQQWATGQDELITPECATYYPAENVFFISNLNRENELDDDGYISIVNADGSIRDVNFTDGLSSPLGNDYFGDFLYVNDENQIVQIDIETGNITDRIVIDEAIDLNGMDIHTDGTIYSADSDGNKIFRVSPVGEVELLIEGEQLNNPNGVFIQGTELIIASMGGNSLLSLDLETNELTTLVDGGLGRADGIIQLDGGNYLISSWTGEVYFVNSDMETRTILDTSEEGINAADIGYIPQDSLLVVPTFFDNRLVAYKVKY